uniref:Ciliary microtubule inner protein 2A-C-like domain-containing protein n=1 Tax=Timema poppense TaxID=170557 RepID=A0A7R9GXQ6_TIMPO|nr:unnamed protein product [Timema poppensis]
MGLGGDKRVRSRGGGQEGETQQPIRERGAWSRDQFYANRKSVLVRQSIYWVVTIPSGLVSKSRPSAFHKDPKFSESTVLPFLPQGEFQSSRERERERERGRQSLFGQGEPQTRMVDKVAERCSAQENQSKLRTNRLKSVCMAFDNACALQPEASRQLRLSLWEDLKDQEGYIHRKCTHTFGEGAWKTNLSRADRDSILDLPVIGSLVYCKSNAQWYRLQALIAHHLTRHTLGRFRPTHARVGSYTGHCPTLKFRFGKRYGANTKDALQISKSLGLKQDKHEVGEPGQEHASQVSDFSDMLVKVKVMVPHWPQVSDGILPKNDTPK